MDVGLVTVGPEQKQEVDALLDYVRSYHGLEGVELREAERRKAVEMLLADEHLGRLWFIESGGLRVGYAALCFGYSIEFGGRDGFLDELFVALEHRGKGIGRTALARILSEAALLGLRAVHLEVARGNARARRLYSGMGFRPREKYLLMSAPV